MTATSNLETLDAFDQLIAEFDAHLVLLLDGKRGFVPGWNKRGASIEEVEKHLSPIQESSNIGIIPYSVNTHVIDIDRGKADDWQALSEVINPLCVFDSRRKIQGKADLGCHIYLDESEHHLRQINLAIDSLIFDSICGTGYVALWQFEAVGLLEALRARRNGIFPILSSFEEIERLITGRADAPAPPSPPSSGNGVDTRSFRELRDGDGRNDALFKVLAGKHRSGIAWQMVERFQSKTLFIRELTTAAFGVNAMFAEKQTPERVTWTVNHIGEYIWRRRNSHLFGTTDSEVQRARGKRRGIAVSKERERFDQKVAAYLAQGFDVRMIAQLEGRGKSSVYSAKRRIEGRDEEKAIFQPAKESFSNQPKNRDESRHARTEENSNQPITKESSAPSALDSFRDSSDEESEGVDYVIYDRGAAERHLRRFDCDDGRCGLDACNVCHALNFKRRVAEERAEIRRLQEEKEASKQRELDRQRDRRQAALDFFAAKMREESDT